MGLELGLGASALALFGLWQHLRAPHASGMA
jgi:hypothetical protein